MRKREEKLNRIVERMLGKHGRVIRISERRGDGGKVMIAEFCEERDARGTLESKGEIRLCWGVKVDGDLTMR